MRRIAMLCVCLGLLCSSGYSVYDALFGVFGSHYSDGTRDERQSNYDREVERWNKYQADSPSEANR